MNTLRMMMLAALRIDLCGRLLPVVLGYTETGEPRKPTPSQWQAAQTLPERWLVEVEPKVGRRLLNERGERFREMASNALLIGQELENERGTDEFDLGPSLFAGYQRKHGMAVLYPFEAEMAQVGPDDLEALEVNSTLGQIAAERAAWDAKMAVSAIRPHSAEVPNVGQLTAVAAMALQRLEVAVRDEEPGATAANKDETAISIREGDPMRANPDGGGGNTALTDYEAFMAAAAQHAGVDVLIPSDEFESVDIQLKRAKAWLAVVEACPQVKNFFAYEIDRHRESAVDYRKQKEADVLGLLD